ncbi:hypothetical protein HF086_010103 [Spodoptera exigua]|uniref:C-type lectin domain-containing protein n=1 Tax=Spodoptera exigua TaxID=7107 RepID=A0A922SU11_SPOEX|nr:hypothetical protein HF086_010103 [Spodoptera exigua]
MVSKILLFVFVFNLVSDYSYGQRNKKFFRKDYKYLEEVEGFYKIHTLHKTWSEAKRACALEGASLFYPENDDEAHAVLSFWNATQPYRLPVSDVYNNWGPGEPNDAGGVEDCVILRQDGTLNDDQCNKKFPFICKKSLQSLEWNQRCNFPNLGTSLDDTGYTCWGTNQPDGGEKEQCGSMFYNGLLNDISCGTRAFFICEHEVDTLSSALDDRFGDAVVLS